MRSNRWTREDAEDRTREMLEAAKVVGPQLINDDDGVFTVSFSRMPTADEKPSDFLTKERSGGRNS